MSISNSPKIEVVAAIIRAIFLTRVICKVK